MGDCKFCLKPAGFLRKKHDECQRAYDNGKNEIYSLARSAALGERPLDNLSDEVKIICNNSFINNSECKDEVALAWSSAVEKAFEDGILTKDEEKRLGKYLECFSLSQKDCENSYTKLVQGAVLRDLIEGKIPERVIVEGNLPFILQKNEKLIWAFNHVSYYEQKTMRQFVGGSQGISVRIAKGVYYRAGAFKGQPIERTETVLSDIGSLGVTDKNIYFGGNVKTLRIPINKILSVTPHSDGITIQRDAASAKPQAFVVGDGWFIYNLLSNITKL